MLGKIFLGLFGAFCMKLGYEKAEGLSCFLIRQACRLLPQEIRTEKQEQYEADSYHTEGEASKLVHAFGTVCVVSFKACSSRLLFDRLAALLLLVFLAPLMLLVSVLIKIDSRDSVFVRRPHYGKGGKEVFIYRFRTACTDNSQIDSDDKTTKLGAFLRQFDIDAVPVLFNVLRGEMVFVGPRPGAVDRSLAADEGHIDQHPEYDSRETPGIVPSARQIFKELFHDD